MKYIPGISGFQLHAGTYFTNAHNPKSCKNSFCIFNNSIRSQFCTWQLSWYEQKCDQIWYLFICHYNNVIMSMMASQITSIATVYSTVYSGIDQRKHQSSVSLAFVWGIHWWPVNSPHKWPVTWKMFPFDDIIMSHQSNIYFYNIWILSSYIHQLIGPWKISKPF